MSIIANDPESPQLDEKTTHGIENVSSTTPSVCSSSKPENPDATTSPDILTRRPSIAEALPLPREILFITTIILAQFTAQAGLGQTIAILHVIGDSFNLSSPGQLSWLIAGYSLTIGSFILTSGRFGDLFGYKRMIIIGFIWFSLWSLVAGLSVYSGHVLFVFARVLQGIGPAITLPNGLALLGATYNPGRRKDMVFAIFGATAPGGAIVGAVFASLLSLAWWPWAFWGFSIFLAMIAVVAVYAIPDAPKKDGVTRRSLRQKLVSLDLPGAVTGITALVLFNFAWNQAPIVGWAEAYVFVLLLVGLLSAAAFFYIELRVAPEPLIPFDALSADVSFVLGCVACGWGSFGIWFYYVWQFLGTFRHESPLLTSAQFVPVAISGAIASICTGLLLSRIRPAWIMTISLLCFLTGNILIATAPVKQIYWAQIFVCTLIIPWGMDMSFPAATIILSNSVSKEHQGIAASLVNTVVNYSISLALGFAGTVEVHVNDGGKTEADALQGLRSALYLSIGLAGFGVLLSLLYVAKSYQKDMRAFKS